MEKQTVSFSGRRAHRLISRRATARYLIHQLCTFVYITALSSATQAPRMRLPLQRCSDTINVSQHSSKSMRTRSVLVMSSRRSHVLYYDIEFHCHLCRFAKSSCNGGGAAAIAVGLKQNKTLTTLV
jgi:hypothetical protein